MFNFNNDNIAKDWSITVWGDSGPVSIRHSAGLTSDTLPVAPPRNGDDGGDDNDDGGDDNDDGDNDGDDGDDDNDDGGDDNDDGGCDCGEDNCLSPDE